MGELILALSAVILCSWLAFFLGVRRERGRQLRYEEVARVKRIPRQGVKLKSIKVRR